MELTTTFGSILRSARMSKSPKAYDRLREVLRDLSLIQVEYEVMEGNSLRLMQGESLFRYSIDMDGEPEAREFRMWVSERLSEVFFRVGPEYVAVSMDERARLSGDVQRLLYGLLCFKTGASRTDRLTFSVDRLVERLYPNLPSTPKERICRRRDVREAAEAVIALGGERVKAAWSDEGRRYLTSKTCGGRLEMPKGVRIRRRSASPASSGRRPRASVRSRPATSGPTGDGPPPSPRGHRPKVELRRFIQEDAGHRIEQLVSRRRAVAGAEATGFAKSTVTKLMRRQARPSASSSGNGGNGPSGRSLARRQGTDGTGRLQAVRAVHGIHEAEVPQAGVRGSGGPDGSGLRSTSESGA